MPSQWQWLDHRPWMQFTIYQIIVFFLLDLHEVTFHLNWILQEASPKNCCFFNIKYFLFVKIKYSFITSWSWKYCWYLMQPNFCQSRGTLHNAAVFHSCWHMVTLKWLYLYCMTDGQLGELWVPPFLHTQLSSAPEVSIFSRNTSVLYPIFNPCFNDLLKKNHSIWPVNKF